MALDRDVARRLADEPIAWLSTVRPDGTPHVTPVWFVFDNGTWWVGSNGSSIKVHNCWTRASVALALPDGRRPVVAEGQADVLTHDFPPTVVEAFATKYNGWNVEQHGGNRDRVLIKVRTTRWLMRGVAQ